MPLVRLAPVMLLALTLAGCAASGETPADPGKIVVATTVAPLTSIVASIGGDKIALHGIVPEGTNSHTFEPPPQVAEVLADADLVFVNGLRLEEPTVQLAQAHAKKGSEIVELGNRALPESEYLYDFSFPKQNGKPNPHLWTNPPYAIRYANEAAAALTAHDPGNKAYYEANRVAFGARATALSEAMKKAQATIPGGKRQLLTYHDAYAYFGRDYGWTVIGAVQPANFEDPTPREVARLIDQVRSQKVPVIFGSEVFPSKVLKQIGKETGARYEDTLRDDDLPGKPGDPEHSWLGLMRYDFRTMVAGLGGDPAALDALDVTSPVPDTAEYPQ